MNQTNILGIHPELPEDRTDAWEHLNKKYPGIIYDQVSDTYTYRGITFDYFKSAVPLVPNQEKTFTLVDQVDPHLWLYESIPVEERWKAFLEAKAKQTAPKKVYKKSWLASLLRWRGGW